MDFLKNNEKLRFVIIAALFVMGLALTFAGWKMTGQLAGLGIMVVGMIFLLSALLVYNKANQ